MKTHNKPCRACKKIFTSAQARVDHEKLCRRQARLSHFEEDIPLQFTPSRSALKGRFVEYCLEPDSGEDYHLALSNSLKPMRKLFEELLRVHKSIKYYISFEALLKKDTSGDEDEFGFHTKAAILLTNNDIDNILIQCKDKIASSIDEFKRGGSGWIFIKFVNICLHAVEYRPAAVA
jgi:hypothetical protein